MDWNPFEDVNISSDPYKTLFVGRLGYDTTEKKLKKEFEAFGPIKSVKLVKKDDKFKGYAFIGRLYHNYYLKNLNIKII